MPIKGATLSLGGTLSCSGGTVKTFTEVGETIKNGVKVTDLSVTDSRLRPTITCINRPAAYDSSGRAISKDKHTMKLVMPKLLADGITVGFPLGEQRLEFLPENTDAEKLLIMSYMGQMLMDADFQNFVLYGATA